MLNWRVQELSGAGRCRGGACCLRTPRTARARKVRAETTLMAVHTSLLYFGVTLVGLRCSFEGQMRLDDVVGGATYGATAIADGDGSRQPSQTGLDGARFQGRRPAELAARPVGRGAPSRFRVPAQG